MFLMSWAKVKSEQGCSSGRLRFSFLSDVGQRDIQRALQGGGRDELQSNGGGGHDL